MSVIKLVNLKLCQPSMIVGEKAVLHRTLFCRNIYSTSTAVHHRTLPHQKVTHKPLLFTGPVRCNSSSSSAPTDDKKIGEEQGESKVVVLRKVLAQYGAFGMTIHIILSLASLAFTYLLISWGVDIEGLFKKLGFDISSLAMPVTAEYSATFVAAYTVHKLTLPIRAAISIVIIRYLVRYFRRIGYFKK